MGSDVVTDVVIIVAYAASLIGELAFVVFVLVNELGSDTP